MKRDPSYILTELYKKRKLGPLYIIRPPILRSPEDHDCTNQWAHHFFCEIISLQKKLSLEQAINIEKLGVSDHYHIRKNKDHKEYKVEEEGVLEFIKAHSYPPLEFPFKLVAVHEAEKLSEKVLNKWLKTLEEPLAGVTTLFLTNSNKELLQTIESRGITLRLAPKKDGLLFEKKSVGTIASFLDKHLKEDTSLSKVITEAQKKKLLKFIKSPDKPHLFLDTIKGSRALQEEIYLVLQEFVQSKGPGPRQSDQWLQEIKWFQESNAFNNAPQERFLGLMQLVQSIESTQ